VLIQWTDLADKDLENIEQYISENNNQVITLDVVINVINSIELVLLCDIESPL
jgi:toxin ParE1/3/4